MAIKRTIWTNNLDLTDEAIQEWISQDPEVYEGMSQDEILEAIYEENDLWFDDERRNLDIATRNPILAIANLGLWNGPHMGYKILHGNVNSIFSAAVGDYRTFFADNHNVQCDDIHHDGTNHYLFRVLVDDEQFCAPLLDAIIKCKNIGEIKAKIRRYSRSILPYVVDVYGWPFSGRRPKVVA